ncbi:MAG TPA: segregation/condensation protein A, partial [Anaerohalosphaeraceae bacterium]|nr:segregation/condensation protein A [Anaerohalosphaeraceae bacterium]
YLVRKEEVDIYDIPIARITQQYVEYIEMLKNLDIDLAGDFLVMAATLMEIKSAMLLPKTELNQQDEAAVGDPRAELVRQLLEYKKYKDAANLLEQAGQQRQLRFTRSNYILEKIKPTQEPELDLDQISIWTLLEAFDAILKATGNINTRYDHIKDDTPIDLYQIELLHRLQAEGPMTLQKVFEGKNNRLAMIGLFLAMLELMRNQLIWVEQPDSTGTIYLKSLTDEPAEQAVQKALYAASKIRDQKPQDEPVDTFQSSDESSGQANNPDSDIDDIDDEFSAELSAIKISSETEEKPRISILELPAQQANGGLPQSANANKSDESVSPKAE